MVVFHALDEKDIQSIAQIQLQHLYARLAKLEISLQVSKEALAALSHVGFDPVFGARPLKRAIQSQIENALAKEILAGNFAAKDAIAVDYCDGLMQFNKIVH